MQGQKDREWRQILSMHSRTGVSVARCTLHMLINNMFYPPGCLGFAWVSAKTKNVGNLGAVAAPKAPKGLLWLGDKLCLFLHFVSSFQVIWTDRRVGPKKKKKAGKLLLCLWSLWGGNSESQSDYLMNSFQSEPLVTFGRWNNVTSRNVQSVVSNYRRAECVHTWTAANTSLLLKYMFKMSHQVDLMLSHLCGKYVSADFDIAGTKLSVITSRLIRDAFKLLIPGTQWSLSLISDFQN